MKLYDSRWRPIRAAPASFSPRRASRVPTEQVDMMTMQHKTPEYTAINPLQRMPSLVLDDGTVITELIAICRYFEALHPEPPLFGVGPKETRMVEMWNSRGNKLFLERGGRVPPPASGDEGAGGAAGAGLGRGEQAARDLVSRIARP